MNDAIIKGTGNSRYLKSVSDFLTQYPDYETFAQALMSGTLPIDLNGINPSGWTQQGTALNKANLLSDTTATNIGLDSTATVNTALNKIDQNCLRKTGTAAAATKLATARTIQTNLGSTSAVSFNGTANITPGVTGTLPISRGGTGASTASQACANLGAVRENSEVYGLKLKGYSSINATAFTEPTEYTNNTACISLCDEQDWSSYGHGNVSNVHDNKESIVAGTNNLVAYGQRTLIVGVNNTAIGSSSTPMTDAFALGQKNTTKQSHCMIGYANTPSSESSMAIAAGYNLVTNDSWSVELGVSNVISTSKGYGNVLIVGGGDPSPGTRRNILRCATGGVYGYGSYNSSGADYAEYFEWSDGNTNHEDRVGRFVTLDGDKIKIADESDDYILGVVSACPSVVGDAAEDMWAHETKTDIFGRFIWEDRVVEATDISPREEYKIPGRNPDYVEGQEYTPRSQRPEWDPVGLLGKLVVIDDGSCQVNGYCAVATGGIATASNERTKYRVMERLDSEHIRVMIL